MIAMSGKPVDLLLNPGDQRRTLTDVLTSRGIFLNARCGQRGLCSGCQVELIEGNLHDRSGQPAPAGVPLRSCRYFTEPSGRVVLRVDAQARIGRAAAVSETFATDVPFILDPLPAVTPNRDTGFAIDLGTTTVVVLLADLGSGKILSRASGFNAQIRFGDNVVTRIAAGGCRRTLDAMRGALVCESLAPLLAEACEAAGRAPSRLAGGTVAGNTTMLHLLAGEDPTSLGHAPFTPRFLESRVLDGSALGLVDSPSVLPVHLLPGLSAYIGADITAGIHATGMCLDEQASLLVDLGTNGEIVLADGERIVGCATAAGPAFEGSGLSCGCRAIPGAISRIRLDGGVFSCNTLGAGRHSAGVCGSAYIDFLALARSIGLLKENGRFDRERWQAWPEAQRATRDGGLAIAPAGAAGPVITEGDIAHLLQAKGAIGAGIESLLGAAGISAASIDRLYLAGGFGMQVRVDHAVAIDLLPGFRPEQVRVTGNSALAGCALALLDRSALAAMDALRRRVEIIELNLQPGFEDRYLDHLALP